MTAERRAYDSGMPPSGHKVSDERLEEFRRIYKETYGEDLTPQEASRMAHRLLALYDSCGGLCLANALRILQRQSLRLKRLPKRPDVRENLLSVLIVEHPRYFVRNSHQHDMLSIISSNVIADSQPS